MPDYPVPSGAPIDVNGTSLWVRTDPFEGGIDERGRPWRTACYLCRGEDANAACDKLKGISNVGFPTPHRYPNNTNLICQSVHFKLKGPRSSGPNLVKAPYAEVYATYGVPEWDVFGDTPAFDPDNPIPWATYRVQGGLEIIKWPRDTYDTFEDPYSFDVESTDPIADIHPAVDEFTYRIPTEDWILRRSMIPNFREFKALHDFRVGAVNKYDLWGSPPGHFLCEPCDFETCYDPSGKKLGEFTLVFRWRFVPWNWEPVPGLFGEFAPVSSRTGIQKYRVVDFAPLLEYGI